VNTGLPRQNSERWPFAAAASTLLALLAVYLWTALNQNHGHFVYAQDDPYIHL
jgi:ABC-type spermidine/putrescine transport system permease subunit I